MKITVENSGTAVGRRGRNNARVSFEADVCSWSDSIGRPWIIRYFLTERLFGPRWRGRIVAQDRISIKRHSMMIGDRCALPLRFVSLSLLYFFFFFLLVLANCFEERRSGVDKKRRKEKGFGFEFIRYRDIRNFRRFRGNLFRVHVSPVGFFED